MVELQVNGVRYAPTKFLVRTDAVEGRRGDLTGR